MAEVVSSTEASPPSPVCTGFQVVPPIKAVHFTQLLTAVNAVRTLAGQSGIAFTSPAPAAGVAILGAHVNDLRNGLTPARSALLLPRRIH